MRTYAFLTPHRGLFCLCRHAQSSGWERELVGSNVMTGPMETSGQRTIKETVCATQGSNQHEVIGGELHAILDHGEGGQNWRFELHRTDQSRLKRE